MPDATTTTEPAEAIIGHNSAAVGEILRENPAVIFDEPDMLQQLVDELTHDIEEAGTSVETTEDRDEIRSRAYRISQLKSSIDKAGKARTEDMRTAIGKVNAVRKDIEVALEALRDRARQPLTDWEQAESARLMKVNGFFDMLKNLDHVPKAGPADWESCIQQLQALTVDEDTFFERTAEARASLRDTIEWAQEGLSRARREEEDRIELEKLRREKAEREEADRQAAAAEEARKAEQRRQAEEAERVRLAEEAARQQAEAKARQEAEAKAAAEREAMEAEQRRKDEEAAAALQAEKERAEAAERRLREEEEARAKAAAEEEARRMDAEHRKKIETEAVAAVAEHGMVSDAAAETIVTAIMAGKIPHVSIKF